MRIVVASWAIFWESVNSSFADAVDVEVADVLRNLALAASSLLWAEDRLF